MLVPAVLVLGFFLWLPASAQQGYRLAPTQVVVESPEHWRAWTAPEGVRAIGEDGWVEPRFLRRQINVSRDAEQFEYLNPFVSEDTLQGGALAGSSPAGARLVLDGDPATFWEPDRADPLEQWFVEVDLGRAVIARRVVLRFVDEGRGDPFLKFRVMVSDGQRFGQEQRRRFVRVGLETRPNKERREYAFDIEPQRPGEAGLEGEIVQFVRIDALDTDGPRAREVGAREYGQLPEEDQGAIDHFRLTQSGREIAIGQSAWQRLPAAERGPVRYFRQERPRLAEVEVEAIGENAVFLTQRERRRQTQEAGFEFLFQRIYTDGLYSSWFPMRTYNPVSDENQLVIDLGARYWLERIALLAPESPPPAFQLRVSDGSISANGERVWHAFDERRNLAGHQRVEERFATREVRFIELRRLEFSRNEQEKGNLSEVQAFGEGYVSEVEMQSPFIRLERPRLFAALEWEGEAPPGTQVELRTRSGEELQQIPHYFATTGREISRTLWELIPESRRPPVLIEERAGPDWSGWSEVYEQSGQAFRSPGPRAFAQVQVRLLSREPLRAARIQSLRLHFERPLVERALGEMWPIWQVEPGVEREFTLYLRPEFAPGDPGFDRLRLRSDSAAPVQVIEVREGTDEALRQGGGRRLFPGALAVEEGAEGAAELVFSQPVRQGGNAYEIRFRTRVFLQSTLFRIELENRARPGRVQVVSDGDASSLIASQSLVVVSDLGGARLLHQVQVEPPVFTPNGDGINEQTQVRLAVFHLRGEKEVEVGVFDLAGRRVRDLSLLRAHPSGEHRATWDGRDQGGALVPPGLYLVRVGLRTDSREDAPRAARLVQVVY